MSRTTRSWCPWSLIVITAAVSGCGATLDQRYYVAVVDQESGGLEFYRYTLHGDAGWNKMRFASGWYSAASLNELVAENVEFRGLQASTQPAEDRKRYFIAGPEGRFRPSEDVRLAVIFASDPAPVLDALNALSQSKQLQDAAAELAKRSAAEAKKPLPERIKEFLDQIKEMQKLLTPTTPAKGG